ncbi:MAG: methyltransferase domain-containing protein, partial [Candidatus Bipolaricaulota bacterium]
MCNGVRLHLGCGNVYKADYVNVDLFDSSVADVKGDVTRLPFATASADGIEAFHVIEHFDYIHCKYALSEWFRVLKGGGELVLETPEISETFKQFLKSDVDSQEQRLQWIFGIDSPGMQHKAGFSAKLLQRLLHECGFVKAKREEATTHLYEAGMRMVCRKPAVDKTAEFVASFRRRVLAELGPIDSYVMIPLEKHVQEVIADFREDLVPALTDIMAASAKTAVVNPGIAIAILTSWMESADADSGDLERALSKIRYLRDRRIHERTLTLWIRAKKEGALDKQFRAFTERLGKDILAYLMDREPDDIGYLLSLEPERIPLFDFDLILMDARMRVNRGVRKFASGDLGEARAILEVAATENPDNLYAHWNLARLGAIAGSDSEY